MQPINSRTRTILMGGAILCASAVVVTIVVGLPVLAGKYLVAAPKLGPLGYTGSVISLLDVTGSELPKVRDRVREVAKVGVVGELKPGTYAAAYAVSSDPHGYDEVTNRVFGDAKGPGPQVHLNPTPTATRSAEDNLASGEWISLHNLSHDWDQAIDALRPPQNSCCSAYSVATAFIEDRLQSGSLPKPVKVVILGDLREEPAPDPFVPPPPEDSQRTIYEGVAVILVRPFSVRGPHTRQQIDTYWQQYFHERGADAKIYDLNGFPGINHIATE